MEDAIYTQCLNSVKNAKDLDTCIPLPMKSAKAVGMDTMIPKTRRSVMTATKQVGSRRHGVRFALNVMEKDRLTSKNEWNFRKT